MKIETNSLKIQYIHDGKSTSLQQGAKLKSKDSLKDPSARISFWKKLIGFLRWFFCCKKPKVDKAEKVSSKANPIAFAKPYIDLALTYFMKATKKHPVEIAYLQVRASTGKITSKKVIGSTTFIRKEDAKEILSHRFDGAASFSTINELLKKSLEQFENPNNELKDLTINLVLLCKTASGEIEERSWQINKHWLHSGSKTGHEFVQKVDIKDPKIDTIIEHMHYDPKVVRGDLETLAKGV